ncbi:MAG TPA: hydrogenase iron-sulfur subunit [Anaerolineaceae bacterium]|nr:hydrogenase iron-sulfur subunit [Anaerolineaceae bacterium]
MSENQPKIVLFQCQWCLYAKKDQDWVENTLPENIHLVKTSCTGRINPLFVLNAIQGGADGVMISGCKPEVCHFKEGNIGARRQLSAFQNLLNHIGYDRSRIRFVWMDLQDTGRIQKELAAFEKDLAELGMSEVLVTRKPGFEGGMHD